MVKRGWGQAGVSDSVGPVARHRGRSSVRERRACTGTGRGDPGEPGEAAGTAGAQESRRERATPRGAVRDKGGDRERAAERTAEALSMPAEARERLLRLGTAAPQTLGHPCAPDQAQGPHSGPPVTRLVCAVTSPGDSGRNRAICADRIVFPGRDTSARTDRVGQPPGK